MFKIDRAREMGEPCRLALGEGDDDGGAETFILIEGMGGREGGNGRGEMVGNPFVIG